MPRVQILLGVKMLIYWGFLMRVGIRIRLYQIWGYWWPKTQTILWAIHSCWMMIQGYELIITYKFVILFVQKKIFIILLEILHQTLLNVQHTIFGWWHIEVYGTDWYIWHRTTPACQGELGFCFLASTLWINTYQIDLHCQKSECSPMMILTAMWTMAVINSSCLMRVILLSYGGPWLAGCFTKEFHKKQVQHSSSNFSWPCQWMGWNSRCWLCSI